MHQLKRVSIKYNFNELEVSKKIQTKKKTRPLLKACSKRYMTRECGLFSFLKIPRYANSLYQHFLTILSAKPANKLPGKVFFKLQLCLLALLFGKRAAKHTILEISPE